MPRGEEQSLLKEMGEGVSQNPKRLRLAPFPVPPPPPPPSLLIFFFSVAVELLFGGGPPPPLESPPPSKTGHLPLNSWEAVTAHWYKWQFHPQLPVDMNCPNTDHLSDVDCRLSLRDGVL